mgnify:CR=1 FL=1
MKSSTTVFGRIVKKYDLPLDGVEDLNIKYEEAKEQLRSFGHRLAGRLDSELEFTNILQSTALFKNITLCMQDYIESMVEFKLFSGDKRLDIISCWINDMQENEYNPPHTHHDSTGFSTVLFLKIPEYVNDVKDPHKFKDGNLGFISHDGLGATWIEPKVGEFFIFEAAHQHMVMPFKVKNKGDIRRSMSFNFIRTINVK